MNELEGIKGIVEDAGFVCEASTRAETGPAVRFQTAGLTLSLLIDPLDPRFYRVAALLRPVEEPPEIALLVCQLLMARFIGLRAVVRPLPEGSRVELTVDLALPEGRGLLALLREAVAVVVAGSEEAARLLEDGPDDRIDTGASRRRWADERSLRRLTSTWRGTLRRSASPPSRRPVATTGPFELSHGTSRFRWIRLALRTTSRNGDVGDALWAANATMRGTRHLRIEVDPRSADTIAAVELPLPCVDDALEVADYARVLALSASCYAPATSTTRN